MKQTAVEWLVEQMPTAFKNLTINKQLIEQAKEMEKKQIKKAWVDGNYNTDSNGNPSENYAISGDKYYQKKTFQSE